MEFTKGDIFNVMSHMGSFKAPSLDGLQATFFKSQWKIIGPSFCKLVGDILNHLEQIENINDTFLALIRKLEEVCNVSYKVITKLLAQRLRMVMCTLVNPCQISFIPQRQSRDNIITAQEIFHLMRNRKGKKGWVGEGV